MSIKSSQGVTEEVLWDKLKHAHSQTFKYIHADNIKITPQKKSLDASNSALFTTKTGS